MAILIGAKYFQLTIGRSLILGDIGSLPRLQPPLAPSATDASIPSPVGYLAVLVPDTTPLSITRSTVHNPTNHVVTLAVQNNPAPVFYTLDGASVTELKTRYVGPITISGNPGQNTTLKFKAFALAQSGYTNSVETTVVLQIPQILDLTVGVANTGNSGTKNVTITANASGDFTIKFTLDGSTPNLTNGTTYAGVFQVSGSPGNSVTVKAIAFPNQPLGDTGGLLQSDLESTTITF